MADTGNTKLIDGAAKNIDQVFSGVRYGLDFYQREYRWDEKNITDLIDDLCGRFLQEYRPGMDRTEVAKFAPYFLGPFVVNSSDGVNNVVDGQQRLTTLTLLLIHMNNLARGRDGSQSLSHYLYSTKYGKMSFTIDVPERAPVMQALVEGKVFDPDTPDVGESSKNIWNRYHDIVELFPDEVAGEPLLHFIDWLLNRVVLVEVGTNDADMALSIFETMNDRGQRLTNTDMLKSFLVAQVGDEQAISAANEKWRRRVGELQTLEKDGDAEFIKTWLRAQHAVTIRERRRDATPQDFDVIGTAFHKWVRDNQGKLGLDTPATFAEFLDRDFDVYSRRYMQLLRASETLDPEMPAVFYNAGNNLTLQYLPILAAIGVDDDDAAFTAKAKLVSDYLDLMLVRRMVNYRNFGYSTISYTIFNLAKDLRGQDLQGVRDVLADRVAGLEDSLDGALTWSLTGRNRKHVAYVLARMTDFLEEGKGVGFTTYIGSGNEPYEVEHIWANKPERYEDEFPSAIDFESRRNSFGGLLLLPKSFNASFNDSDYAHKLPLYFGQNLLAQSLTPQAYDNNPQFSRVRQTYGLPFRPYPDAFTGADILERQKLYHALCSVIWDPERLDLGGGVAAKQPRDFYVNFPDDDERSWDDARQYGFLCAGGGAHYSDKMALPRQGDRVFAYIPGSGYVGIGVVRQEKTPAHELEVITSDGTQARLGDVPLKATKMWEHREDSELQQYAIGVNWQATTSRSKALKDSALFHNQTIVCRLSKPDTIAAVEQHLGLAEGS